MENIYISNYTTNRGSTAIGHPLGATMVRLAGTVARILKDKKGKYGIANACVGGG